MKKDVSMRNANMPGVWKLLLLFVTVGLLSGCGAKTAKMPDAGLTDDQKAISSIISSIADIALSTERLREVFTKDGAPTGTEAAKFKNYMFRVNGEIVVNGTTATIPVAMETYDDPPQAAEQTWTATNEGGVWKLSAAPLP